MDVLKYLHEFDSCDKYVPINPGVRVKLFRICVIQFMSNVHVYNKSLYYMYHKDQWCLSILKKVSVFYIGCNNAGFYGSNCDKPCPTNCKDSTCHIQNGACFTCKPGWTDMHCNKSK